MRPALVPLILLLGCPAEPGPPPPDPPVAEEAIPWITDADGRVLILHGMNVMNASKSAPDRMPPIDEAVVQRMRDDWHFNLARFLIFWDRLEPTPGVLDESYFVDIRERLDWFERAGIHVVLDMHQDVYAQRFCCDGAPEWAIRDDGEPFELQDQWFLNYFQPAVKHSFDNFWLGDDGDHGDLQEHYADAWVAVAERMGDHPAVLGYDLMNEPHPGSEVDVIELLGTPNPGGPHVDFDRERLGPFYQRLIDRIRTVDTERWIFFETRYGAPGNGLQSWLDPLVDSRTGAPRLAAFPHYYSLDMEQSGAYTPATDDSLATWEEYRVQEAQAQGSPLLIGEWGFDGAWTNAEQALRDVLAMADRSTSGWAYWSLDPGGWGIIDGDWNEKWTADLLVRPYARATAGIPQGMSFDPDSRTFHLEIVERAGVTGPTEISLPATRHYPDGWELTVSDADGSWTSDWDPETEVLTIELPSTGLTHVLEITP